ncbi:MAG: recombinase family protein, partial [Microbacteriaceae bacterium]|nr:recombinase family protein [Microbacteriaceae bacterium]
MRDRISKVVHMSNVALYLRISKDSEGLSLGVARQRAECELVIAAKRLDAPVEYVDNSVSAYGPKARPDYVRLLADVRAGKVKTVVVWDLDRLTRRPIEVEEWIDLHEQTGVNLLTVSESVDLSTDNGRMFLRIKGAVARGEVERKSARQKAANRQKVAAGIPTAGVRPMGWEKDRMTLNKGEADQLRKAYTMILAGDSIHAVARMFNAEGPAPRRSADWGAAQVRKLFLRERNAGLLDGKPSQIEPVVRVEDYLKVRALLESRMYKAAQGRAPVESYLSGVMVCGVCGKVMRSNYSTANGKRIRNYLCSTKLDQRGTDTRKHVAVVAHIAEFKVKATLYGLFSSEAQNMVSANPEGLAEVTDELLTIATERTTWTEALGSRGADSSLILRKLSELADREDALTAHRANLLVAGVKATELA